MAGATQGDYLKYEHAAVAFARFCHRAATDTPEALIGAKAKAVWFDAAHNSASSRHKRIGIYALSGCLIAIAPVMVLWLLPAIAALLPALSGSWLLGNTMRLSYRSDEPRLETLIDGATPEQRDCILNLEEFCKRAASGKFGVVERFPDGSTRELDADRLKCFAADGGKLLILSNEPAAWLLIRRRPVPRGQLLIDIRGAVAATELSSKTLIDLDDAERFDAILQWLLGHARASNSDATGFRKVLALIVAFRRTELAGISFESQKEVLEKEGYSRSMLEKVHSGNYPPFQRFLRSLPLNEIP